MEENLIRPSIKELKEYIPGKTPKEPGIVKFSSNENPFGPSPKALEAIAKESKNLQIYPDQKSILLREALAKKLMVEEGSIIIGNGSDEIMQLAAATFLKPGEEAIIPKNTAEIPAIPLERPFRLSKRLNAFVIPTIQNTVKNILR